LQFVDWYKLARGQHDCMGICAGERVLQPGTKPREAAVGLHDRAQAAADAGRLGSIKDVIMECLHNDPQMRPTAQSIVPVRITFSAWNSAFGWTSLRNIPEKAESYLPYCIHR
jgi:hypothetical protein